MAEQRRQRLLRWITRAAAEGRAGYGGQWIIQVEGVPLVERMGGRRSGRASTGHSECRLFRLHPDRTGEGCARKGPPWTGSVILGKLEKLYLATRVAGNGRPVRITYATASPPLDGLDALGCSRNRLFFLA